MKQEKKKNSLKFLKSALRPCLESVKVPELEKFLSQDVKLVGVAGAEATFKFSDGADNFNSQKVLKHKKNSTRKIKPHSEY